MGLFNFWTESYKVAELKKQVERLLRDRDNEISKRRGYEGENNLYKRLLVEHERGFRKRNNHIKRLQRRILAESLLEGKDQLLSDIFRKRTDD